MTISYVILVATLALLSITSDFWRIGVFAVSLFWAIAVFLSFHGNATAQKLSRLGLCACLGLGLGMLFYGLLVLFIGYQDSPSAALAGVLYAQVILTLPCGVLLYLNRARTI
jgi:drug/metabolite transporter (DMT)-like permease